MTHPDQESSPKPGLNWHALWLAGAIIVGIGIVTGLIQAIHALMLPPSGDGAELYVHEFFWFIAGFLLAYVRKWAYNSPGSVQARIRNRPPRRR